MVVDTRTSGLDESNQSIEPWSDSDLILAWLHGLEWIFWMGLDFDEIT